MEREREGEGGGGREDLSRMHMLASPCTYQPVQGSPCPLHFVSIGICNSPQIHQISPREAQDANLVIHHHPSQLAGPVCHLKVLVGTSRLHLVEVDSRSRVLLLHTGRIQGSLEADGGGGMAWRGCG